jgi:predicted DNA-binding protein (MmcQ/YjbR family)
LIQLDNYNEFFKSLPVTTYVIQWHGSHVWKVADKVFAIGVWNTKKHVGITFKASEITFECLKDTSGFRRAPYLASRGMKWLQCYDEKGHFNGDIKAHLTESHRIVSLGLTKKKQRELGLNDLLNTFKASHPSSDHPFHVS